MSMLGLLRLAWAAPCSVVGLLCAGLAFAAGGSIRRVGNTLEAALRDEQRQVPPVVSWCSFGAITFGHVIVGQSHEFLAQARPHERVHVRQYEVLGVFFLLAYPAASAFALLQGRCPYRGNYFERQAARLSAPGESVA